MKFSPPPSPAKGSDKDSVKILKLNIFKNPRIWFVDMLNSYLFSKFEVNCLDGFRGNRFYERATVTNTCAMISGLLIQAGRAIIIDE